MFNLSVVYVLLPAGTPIFIYFLWGKSHPGPLILRQHTKKYLLFNLKAN